MRKFFGNIIHSPERSEEHTSELQSQSKIVCRLLLEKKNGQANDRREEQTGTGHRIRRHSRVLSSQSRRTEERSYPASRRTTAVSDPGSRGQQAVPDSCS